MITELSGKRESVKIAQAIEEISGENPYKCYQCGRCSAGCPSAEKMDILPNQVIRLLQAGDESVLDCGAIWVCAACFTCDVRCPRGVNISRIMEGVRQYRLRRKYDNVKPEEIPESEYEKLPQIALVSAFRKFTG